MTQLSNQEMQPELLRPFAELGTSVERWTRWLLRAAQNDPTVEPSVPAQSRASLYVQQVYDALDPSMQCVLLEAGTEALMRFRMVAHGLNTGRELLTVNGLIQNTSSAHSICQLVKSDQITARFDEPSTLLAAHAINVLGGFGGLAPVRTTLEDIDLAIDTNPRLAAPLLLALCSSTPRKYGTWLKQYKARIELLGQHIVDDFLALTVFDAIGPTTFCEAFVELDCDLAEFAMKTFIYPLTGKDGWLHLYLEDPGALISYRGGRKVLIQSNHQQILAEVVVFQAANLDVRAFQAQMGSLDE